MEPSAEHSEREETLTGGSISAVAKVGDTVRRLVGPWMPAVHALLRHLEALGSDGAPKVLGIDGQGREVLFYVPRKVPELATSEVVTKPRSANFDALYSLAYPRSAAPPDAKFCSIQLTA